MVTWREISTTSCRTAIFHVTTVLVSTRSRAECRKEQPTDKWNQQNQRPKQLSNGAHLPPRNPQPRDETKTEALTRNEQRDRKLPVTEQEVDEWRVAYHLTRKR
jgi:hypothetical protein